MPEQAPYIFMHPPDQQGIVQAQTGCLLKPTMYIQLYAYSSSLGDALR